MPPLTFTPLNSDSSTSQSSTNLTFTPLSDTAVDNKGGLKFTPLKEPKESYNFFEAFGASFAEEATLFRDLNDPSLEADQLNFNAKVGKALGAGVAFFGFTGLATVATGPFGGLAMLGSTASKLQKGAQMYQKAKKLKGVSKAVKTEAMADAVAVAGIGVKNPGIIKKLGFNGPSKAHIDKFMRLASKDVSAARRYAIGKEMGRESLIWGSTGQLMVDEDASFKERATVFAQDSIGGALFAFAPAMRFAKAGNSVLKKAKVGVSESVDVLKKPAASEIGLYFGAGAMMGMPDQEEMSGSEEVGARVLTGVLTGFMGKFFGGATLTRSREDSIRALERIGITDEAQKLHYAATAEALASKEVVKVISKDFEGIEFISRTGQKGQGQTKAVVKEIKVGEDQKLKVVYDRLNMDGTVANKNVVKDFDEFTLGKKNKKGDRKIAEYKRLDDNKVQEVLHNIVKNDKDELVRHSWFKNEKDISNLINRGKFGIITANNPSYMNNIIRPLIGESQNEKLVRELLARGYESRNMMTLRGTGGDGVEGGRLIIKDLKEKDAIELAKMFGQESVVTQKGMLHVKRGGKAANEIKSVTYTKLEFGVGGESMYGKIASVGGTKGGGQIVRGEDVSGTILTTQSKTDGNLVLKYKMKGDAQSIKDPTLSKAFKFQTVDDLIQSGAEQSARKNILFTTESSEKIQLIRKIEELEIAQKLKSSPSSKVVQTEHEGIKAALFGTNSMKNMSIKQLEQYGSLLKGDESWVVRYNKESGSIIQRNAILKPTWLNKNLAGLETWWGKAKNVILPINTKYKYMGIKLGSKELVRLNDDLTDMVVMRDKLKGAYKVMRNEHLLITRNLSKESTKKLDESLTYFIDSRDSFKAMRPTLNAQETSAMKRMVSAHKKYTKEMFKEMKKAGVKEKTWNPKLKRYEYSDLTESPNFVSLTTTDEAAEYFRLNSHAFDSMVTNIMTTDKRFLNGGIYHGLPDKERLKIAEEIFNTIIAGSKQHGMFGAQYTRMGNFPPKIFLDTSGRIIRGVDDMTLKQGMRYKDEVIGRVIDFYEPNYAASMDRYASRAANITASTKFFGHQGVYRGRSREFAPNINERWRKIQRQTSSNEHRTIKDGLEADLKMVLHGNGYDEITGPIQRNLVSWTASLGLSSPLSAVKNFLLGNVQMISTFGLAPVVRNYYKMLMNPEFRKQAFNKARSSGALSASESLLETALVPRRNMGTIQKGLTWAMERAEYTNRLVSVASGDLMAQDALKVLRNKPVGFFSGMDKSVARRVLKESLELSDEQISASIKKGAFGQDALDKIYFMSHSTTQGLADPVFMPKFMGKKFVKPLTLFYRIAYRVQENVYKNAYRPLIDNGEVAPMMRYVAATTTAGAVLQNITWKMNNQDPKAFADAGKDFIPTNLSAVVNPGIKGEKPTTFNPIELSPEEVRRISLQRAFEYFIEGEGLALASGIAEDRPIMQQFTPAVIQMPKKMIGALATFSEGALKGLGDDANGADELLMKKGIREMVEAIPVANQIIKIVEGNINKINFKEFQNLRSKQSEYRRDIQNKESMATFNDDVHKTLFYKTTQRILYSDDPIEKKIKHYKMLVAYFKHQYDMNNVDRTNEFNSLIQAKKMVDAYIKDSKPIQLSKKRTQNRKSSDYQDFYNRLSPEDQKKARDMEKVYLENSRAWLQATRNINFSYLMGQSKN